MNSVQTRSRKRKTNCLVIERVYAPDRERQLAAVALVLGLTLRTPPSANAYAGKGAA